VVGSGVKRPEEPKQQPAAPSHELSENYRREQERHSGVLENPIRVPRPLPQNPGEQRGEAEPFQPTPAEQRAKERLDKPPPQKEEEVVETLDPEVEEAIRAYAMGDLEEEAQLREQAKNDPDLRRELLHPGFSLAYFTPPIPHEDDSS
jgi:hypothetical protein